MKSGLAIKVVHPRDENGIEMVHWNIGKNESVRVEGYFGEYYGVSWTTVIEPNTALKATLASNPQDSSHVSLKQSSFTPSQIEEVADNPLVENLVTTMGSLGIFDVTWPTHSLRYSAHLHGEFIMAYLSPEPIRQLELRTVLDQTGTDRVRAIFGQCMPDIIRVVNNNITPDV